MLRRIGVGGCWVGSLMFPFSLFCPILCLLSLSYVFWCSYLEVWGKGGWAMNLGLWKLRLLFMGIEIDGN
jgi:hypothetical protein